MNWLKNKLFGLEPLMVCYCGHHNGLHWRMHGRCLECQCRVFTREDAA